MFTALLPLLKGGHRKPSRRPKRPVRLWLEVLEERWAPSTDIWQPGAANALWSNKANWSEGHPPMPSEQVVFDGNVANKPVEIDSGVNPTPFTINIQNVLFQNNYSAQMTLDAGITLDAAFGFNFSAGTANIDFKGTGASKSVLEADGGTSQLAKFQFTDQRGQVYQKAGALILSQTGTSDSYSDFIIGAGGQLTVNNDAAVVNFHKGAGITIQPSGSMTVLDTGFGAAVLSDSGDGGIIENWGSFNYKGGNNETTVDMAFLNHDQATFDTGEFVFGHSSPLTNGYSYWMDNTAGAATTLKNGLDLVVADPGYYQTGGLLSVADSNQAEIQGYAEIDGGKVQLGTATTFGTLKVSQSLDFNGGEFDPKINGPAGGAGKEDSITAYQITVKAGTLKVNAINGGVAANQTWKILVGTASSPSPIGDFTTKQFPGGVRGPDSTQAPKDIYQLDS